MRTRGITRKTASAAVACLPAALASLLVGFLPGPGAAATEPDVHAQIERASKSSRVVLELVDGQTIAGGFYGFVGNWRDTVAAAIRYEAWRQARPGGVPPLGEPMSVILATGDTLRGNFRGVGATFLVLGSGNSRFDVPAYVNAITDARAEGGASLAPWAELRGRMLDAPSYIGVGLKRGTQVVMVSRETILAARGEGKQGGNEAWIVLAAIAGGVLLCAAANSAEKDAKSDCSSSFDEFFTCWNRSSRAGAADDPFGASDVTHGPQAWGPGETRRP